MISRSARVVAEEIGALVETPPIRLNRRADHWGLRSNPPDYSQILKEALKDAEVGAEKAYRRAINAKFNADDAAKAADKMQPGTVEEAQPPKKANPEGSPL